MLAILWLCNPDTVRGILLRTLSSMHKTNRYVMQGEVIMHQRFKARILLLEYWCHIIGICISTQTLDSFIRENSRSSRDIYTVLVSWESFLWEVRQQLLKRTCSFICFMPHMFAQLQIQKKKLLFALKGEHLHFLDYLTLPQKWRQLTPVGGTSHSKLLYTHECTAISCTLEPVHAISSVKQLPH